MTDHAAFLLLAFGFTFALECLAGVLRWRRGLPVLLVLLCAVPVRAATFVVDDTAADVGNGDDDPGDGICATSTATCTLRAAIQEANALAGPDTIVATIAGDGPHTITPGLVLPTITDEGGTLDFSTAEASSTCGDLWLGVTPVWNVTIDLTTLDAPGLAITADDYTVRGIRIINGNPTTAAQIQWSGDGVTVQCSNLADGGTNAHGLETAFALADGTNATIGGPNAGDGNVIGGNGSNGITLLGNGHMVQGNFIGTNAAGDTADGNGTAGIKVSEGTGHVIGGSGLREKNLVSANTGPGITIDAATSGAVVSHNWVGLGLDGEADLCNGSNIEDSGTGTTLVQNRTCSNCCVVVGAEGACLTELVAFGFATVVDGACRADFAPQVPITQSECETDLPAAIAGGCDFGSPQCPSCVGEGVTTDRWVEGAVCDDCEAVWTPTPTPADTATVTQTPTITATATATATVTAIRTPGGVVPGPEANRAKVRPAQALPAGD